MKDLRILFTMCALLLLSVPAQAYDFKVDGIFYHILSVDEKTVEVTYDDITYTDVNTMVGSYTGNVVIPATVTYNNITFQVVRIGDGAFRLGSELLSVQLPMGITTLGEYSFCDCPNLADVTLPSTVTRISDRAFSSCKSFKHVVIPASVTHIGDYAYERCDGVESLVIEDSSVGYNTGYWGFAFEFPNIRSVYLGRNGGGWAKTWDYTSSWYAEGKLESVEMGSKVTEVPWHFLYADCPSLKTLTIGTNVQIVRDGAFAGCYALTSIEFPASVQTIEGGVLSGGFMDREMALKDVKFNSAVESIGENAFGLCKNLERIGIKATTPPSLPENAFESTTYLAATLYVPAGGKSTYAATKYWSNFQQIKEGDFDLSISAAPTESVQITKTSHGFQITGVAAGQRVTVYRADGTLLQQLQSTGHTLSVPLAIHQVYLIQIGDTTHKVAF